MPTMRPIGTITGVPVHVATGLHIDMTECAAVTFQSYVATGDNTLTIKESTGAGTSEQNLVVIDRVETFPGTGGTVTEVTQTAAATFTNADATNDTFSVTVFADQLSAGFTHLEGTVDAGTLVAFQHGLANGRGAASMATPIG